MTDALAEALAFVERHGVVLASARGPAPRLIDAIAGEPIAGNWWSHPRANEIYRVLSAASDSESVLVCRLVRGKITLVHRRLWPALVRVADRFAPEQLAEVRNEHTASGRHVGREVPFPDWVPREVAEEARKLAEAAAVASLSAWLEPNPKAGRGAAIR
jgi:hypothetical protein